MFNIMQQEYKTFTIQISLLVVISKLFLKQTTIHKMFVDIFWLEYQTQCHHIDNNNRLLYSSMITNVKSSEMGQIKEYENETRVSTQI